MARFLTVFLAIYMLLAALTHAVMANPAAIPYPLKAALWAGIAYQIATWLTARNQTGRAE